MLHGFQGISELFDLKAFWGSLCSWLSTSLHALWCSPAWGAFEASREKHVPGNGAWREESSRVALRTGLWRLEATVLRQMLAVRGQRHVWLSLAWFCSVLEQQRETRAPWLHAEGKHVPEYQVLIVSSVWPEHHWGQSWPVAIEIWT